MDTGDAPNTGGPSRRLLLAGAAAVGLAGGVGVAVGFLQPVTHGARTQEPPAALTEALAAEQRLLAEASAALRRHPQLRAVLVQVRRDHAAHARALRAELAEYRAAATATPVGGTRSARPAVPAPDRAGLRRVEKLAAADAAARAARLSGRSAALLASIAACEATHAELLRS